MPLLCVNCYQCCSTFHNCRSSRETCPSDSTWEPRSSRNTQHLRIRYALYWGTHLLRAHPDGAPRANKYYRNSEFVAARDIYVWINLALKNSTDLERKGYAHKAAVMLLQMSKGEKPKLGPFHY